jgi:hypothetical protein
MYINFIIFSKHNKNVALFSFHLCRIIEGSNTMEIIAHGAHMHEMLLDIGIAYKKIRARPPKAGRHRKAFNINPHCNENPIYVFLFWKLCGLSPNFHILCVRERFIVYNPRIGPHIFLQQNRQTDAGNI